MTRNAFDVGDRVRWPITGEAASDSSDRYLTVEDRLDTRYRSGNWYFRYLYRELFDRMIEDMHTNVADEFDNVILVIGEEGKGKSNLSYHVAKSFDPDFDLSKSLVYSWLQFLDSVSEDPQKVYWFDEAVLVAAGRDWMKESNKMLIKSLQIIRSMKLAIIFNIPSIDAVDLYIRSFRTRYLLIAHEMRWNDDSEAHRGYAELKIPLTKQERARLPKTAGAEEGFRSVGYFRFPKMTGEDKVLYEQRKAQIQKETLEEMRETAREQSGKSRYARDKKSLEALVSYLCDVEGKSYAEVADLAGMPYNTVKTMAWRMRQKGEENDAW